MLDNRLFRRTVRIMPLNNLIPVSHTSRRRPLRVAPAPAPSNNRNF